jgi:peptidoglycan biosynthesis protein MviN/MurJ (putative lipid II flippase)
MRVWFVGSRLFGVSAGLAYSWRFEWTPSVSIVSSGLARVRYPQIAENLYSKNLRLFDNSLTWNSRLAPLS